MSVINAVPLLEAAGGGDYTIARSVRLRSSATAYLSRTPASASNRTTWTWSAWVKRGVLGGVQNTLFSSTLGSTDATYFQMAFGTVNPDSLLINSYNITTLGMQTAALFRDPSAWYHIVFALDTTQATASNRVKLYVNNVQQTSFLTYANYPPLNSTFAINSTAAHNIGASNATSTFDGYLTEINFIDGQALTPSSFGSTNAITGVWQPAKYTGTYGTNGFYLNFSDNSSNTATTIGKDYSGNGNNWTPNNISVTAGTTYDSMQDVPTLTSLTAANYCTWNPLFKFSFATSYAGTFSNGNLQVATGGNATQFAGTLELCDGAYYEVTAVSIDVNRSYIGLFSPSLSNLTTSTSALAYNATYNVLYSCDGGIWVNTTTGSNQPLTGSTWTNGDVISVAYKSGKIYLAKNGVWQNSGVPASGTGFVASGWNAYGALLAYCGYNSTFSANFGQQPFSYTPPTGFVALNTYNLPASTITNGAAYMAATLYTGSNSTNAVSNAVNGVSFQPDFVWAKNRSSAFDHNLLDSVRGVGKNLQSNLTAAEDSATRFASLDTGGFTLNGNYANTNQSGSTYVGWQWKAGGTSASNTNGSITSTVSVGATQGFSVVTYTGTGANATVGHGLGVVPSMIIVKVRNLAGEYWPVRHTSIAATNGVYLNATDASGATTDWNNTAPTSTVFSIGTNNRIGGAYNYVAYCFAAVAGYSAFGSYTGNGSTDGPFVYTGFRPRYILVKCSSSTEAGEAHWECWDTSRTPYNVSNQIQYLDLSTAESTSAVFNMDILSNGFKLRPSAFSYGNNASGQTYIYAAFAENPLKFSLAR
jgi:hypothetical protein